MNGIATPVNTCASAEAIQSHYDLSNAFYQLWLDPGMVYSCALWEGEEDLTAAQVNKLDWHLHYSGVQPGERLLDIGCGWGSLLERAIRAGVHSATGLTLSQAQADAVRSRELPGVTVRLESWVEHKPEVSYDGIVSIGAFEHFARPEQSEKEKFEGYRRFFEFCHRSLKSNGRLSLQTIFSERPTRDADCFLGNEIYPESDLPHLDEIVKSSLGLFEVELLRNDRTHYARTLRCWLNNLQENKAKAIDIVGADMYAKYEKYLGVSIVGFHTGAINLTRIAMRRIESGRV